MQFSHFDFVEFLVSSFVFEYVTGYVLILS